MPTSIIAAAILALLTLMGAVFAPDPLLILAVGGTLVFGIVILWPVGKLPILLLPFLVQMLSVVMKPLQTVLTGKPLVFYSDFGFTLEPAVYLSLISLVIFAIGMRVGAGTQGGLTVEDFQAAARRWPERSVFKVAITAMLVGHAADSMSGMISPLREPMLAVGALTYAGLFLFIFWSLVTGRRGGLVGLVTAVELVIGMSGYFSEFRFVIFAAALAVMCSQQRFGPRGLAIGGVVLSISLFAVIFWSWVKPDYRDFLSGGARNQVVVVSMNDRIAYLADAVDRFDGQAFDDGLERFVKRQSYIDFLAGTIENESLGDRSFGGRTAAAIKHMAFPRLLWPGKPPLESDTVVTERYTGLRFVAASITSISIGYLGELFIDFSYGAPFVTFLFGCLVGLMYTTLLKHKGLPILVNLAMAVTMVFPVMIFERALVKVIAPTVMTFIVMMLVQHLVLPRILPTLGIRRLPGQAAGPKRPVRKWLRS